MAEIITGANFEEKVLQADTPIVVDFYADWCGPCKMMAPTVDQLATDNEGRVGVYKVNTDKDGALAASYGIMSIPTLIFFKDGKEVDRVVGVVQRAEIAKRLSAL